MQSDVPTLEADDEDDEAASSSDESSDGEPVVPLATGREKRINQGNRMRALLEEEGLIEDEELFREEEDDVDFQAKDEEDVFDSDFGSTDSEDGAEDEGEDAGEKQLERDAKAERRDARGKKKAVHTPFLPSFARQTKQQARRAPVASTSASTLDDASEGPPPKKRKISLAAVNAIAGITPRESSRKSSVAFKKTIEVRLLENEQRRATLPKPVKKATVTLTQADLIAEALETEEINRASLLAFYAAEEDRRAADRIAGMRYEIVGPKLTFLSRLEGVPRVDKGKGVEGSAAAADTAAAKLESGRRRLIEVIGEAGKEGWRPNMGMGEGPAGSAAAAAASTPTPPVASTSTLAKAPSEARPTPMDLDPPLSTSTPLPAAVAGDVQSDQPLDPPLPSAPEGGPLPTDLSTSTATPTPSLPSLPHHSSSTTIAPPSSIPLPSAAPPLAAPTSDLATTQPYARNYVILSEFDGTRQEEMTAIFGEHHEWGSVKVVPSRSRVLHRKVPLCPLTGLPAPYRDPRTMTPYSSLAAYRTLTALVDQSYPWDPTQSVFTGKAGYGLQKELEDRHSSSLSSSRGKGKAVATASTSGAAPTTTTTTPAENPYGQSYGARVARNRGREDSAPSSGSPQVPAASTSSTAGARPPSRSSTPVASKPSSSASSSAQSKAKPASKTAKPPPVTASALPPLPGPSTVSVANGSVPHVVGAAS